MAGPTFDDRDGWIWFDGQMTPGRDAKVHVLTHALHYGSAVFEGERAYGGVIFKSTQHSERLKESARILDFEVPWTVAEIDAAKALALARNDFVDAYIRPLARRRAIEIVERRISPEELSSFGECFITGAAAEVTPVGEIGPHKYAPAALTAALIDDYSSEVQPKSKAA